MKIALVCAYPRQNNLGMVSVDLAAKDFFLKCGITNLEVDKFSIEGDFNLGSGSGLLKYHYLNDPEDQLKSYDLICFWGDFLHSEHYFFSVQKYLLKSKKFASKESVKKHLLKCLFLYKMPQTFINKSMCIGNTIYLNNAVPEDPEYELALRQLYKGCNSIFPREPISALTAKYYSDTDNVFSGIDNAFFLDRYSKVKVSQESQLGYSFGRGVLKSRLDRITSKLFVNKVAKKNNLKKVTDIGWLKSSGNDPLHELDMKVHLLKSCKLVVTDTYHCAVTCLREKVPFIVIGRGTDPFQLSTDDKKKELLMLMFQAQQSYYYIENNFPRIVNLSQAGASLSDAGYFENVFDNVDYLIEKQIEGFSKQIKFTAFNAGLK